MMAGAGATSIASFSAWAIAVYGIVLIVTGSKIAEPLRRLIARYWTFGGYLVSCPMCFGFWVGGALSRLGLALWTRTNVSSPVFDALATFAINGAAASATAWVFHVLLAKLGAEEL